MSGTFCSLNKGDAAMQLAACRILQKLMPGVQVVITTPYPDLDRHTYGSCPLLRSSRRRMFRAFWLLARAVSWALLNRYLRMAPARLLRDPELRALRGADLLVDLSGDTITEDYGIGCVVSHLMPILTAIFLGRPVVLCAQTIGPFRLTRHLARPALNRAALITAREKLSFDYLRRIGVTRPPVYLTNDVAFVLEAAPPARVDHILQTEGIDTSHGPLFGITVSRLLGHRFDPEDPQRFEALIAGVADDFIAETDASVVFVSHVLGPGEERDDRILARAVRARMRHRDRADIVAGDYRPEELKGLIGRCEIFLGLRMHANIAALAMTVPTLAIAYSRKTHGIMRMVGQERWMCDIGELTRAGLGARLQVLWRERAHVRSDLTARNAEMQRTAMQNFRLVQRLVAGQG